MPRHLSYANVVATLALIFAMGGSAVAASHYLINSTKQINPKVLKKLTGKTGARGKEGPQGKEGVGGKEGTAGKEGKEGKEGVSALSALPSGQTESGDYSVLMSSATGFMEDTISFPIALSAPIASSKIVWTFNKSQAPFCEGPGHASPGYMCIYSAGHVNIEQPEFSNPEVVGGKANETGIHGVDVGWETVSGGKEAYDYGTWSVTAP